MRIVFLSSYRRIINTEVFFFQEAFAAPNTSVIIQKQRTLLITFNQTMFDDKLKLAEKMAEERTQRKKQQLFFQISSKRLFHIRFKIYEKHNYIHPSVV